MYGQERLPAHGTVARYKHRTQPCSCDRCRAAGSRQRAETRRRKNTPQPIQLEMLDPYGRVATPNPDGA